VCDLALGASMRGLSLASRFKVISGRLDQAMKDEAFFGACNALSTMASHYDNINLQAIDEGFMDGQSYEELGALEQVATPTADALSQLVSQEVVLQGREEVE
jgi:hypothetical protein